MTQGARPATVLEVLDTHVAGEPARLVLNAAALLRGATPAERREDLLTRQEWMRTGLMREPRGHRDMFGVVVVPPSGPTADVGAVFMEHDGAPMSCGHGTIGLVSAIIDRGIVPGLDGATTVRVETPAGVVPVEVNRDARGDLASVVLHQPAMRVAARFALPHPGRADGEVDVVLVGGSTWVLLVDEAGLGVEIAAADSGDLLALVRGLRAEVLAWLRGSPAELGAAADEAARHLAGSPIAIVGRAAREDCEVRTFVGFGERSIDRSPCGTAVSALVAVRATDGRLRPGQWLSVEGVSGERFEASVAPAATDGADDGDGDRTDGGRISALIRGRGFVTGSAVYEFDPADPFATGFAV